ncbi:hypothetical protein [Roseomonas populi]|uniref:Uncharacterized protein n=1 Tax=Roseomonas populi TaxID=3121582 RepID=A0ABT1XAA2_9PROT|nr:hypothetical protein [Roseomonas pecuniae]MCR0985035.1 hypothetical protein [Roseomonas pecuniae]
MLKAQLLAPSSPKEAEDAWAAAARRLELLDELARMRAGADWLTTRPQLGRAMFGRGQATPAPASPQAELLVAFLEATLTMLEGREGQTAAPISTYRPSPPDLWRIPDAARRITELLGQIPMSLTLERCLPPIPSHASDRPVRLRAALASTLVAGLEMARNGIVGPGSGRASWAYFDRVSDIRRRASCSKINIWPDCPKSEAVGANGPAAGQTLQH